jgi:hypothetical protein
MTWRSDGAARPRGWVRELSAHTSVLAWLCPFERTPRGRVVHRHSPQLPRALLGRLRMCRKAGAGLPGTREDGRLLALARGEPGSHAKRGVPEQHGFAASILRMKGDLKSCLTHCVSAHALSPCHLSLAKCIGNTRESLMLASCIVAQRVSAATQFSARKSKACVSHMFDS